MRLRRDGNHQVPLGTGRFMAIYKLIANGAFGLMEIEAMGATYEAALSTSA